MHVFMCGYVCVNVCMLFRFLEMLATKSSEEVNYLMGEIKVGLHKDVVWDSRVFL